MNSELMVHIFQYSELVRNTLRLALVGPVSLSRVIKDRHVNKFHKKLKSTAPTTTSTRGHNRAGAIII